MRRHLSKAVMLTVAVVLIATVLLSTLTVPTGAAALTKSVIVQLKKDPTIVAKTIAEAKGQAFDPIAYEKSVIADQNTFLNKLSLSGVPYTINGVVAPNGVNGETANIAFRFSYIYNGITLDVPEAAIPTIKAMSQVKSVEPNTEFRVNLDKAINYTRANQLYGDPAQIHMGDNLASGGVEGQGIYIAVIDTGIDWTNPMFGGDPTPPRFGIAPEAAAVNHNQKVVYYMNFTAGAAMDDFGHGTHVAGITSGYYAVAPGPDLLPGTADDIPIHGVAPQAKLMGYKTLTGVGTGVAASSILAMEDAVRPMTLTGYPKPVAHVINMSLGDTSNNPDGPAAIAADNATLGGTIVVAAAGNSGAATATNVTGESTLGSPGTGRRVLTVGATLDPGSFPNKLDEIGGGNRTDMKAFPLDGSAAILNDITSQYVDCGLADTPDLVPDTVAGKICLIARGSTVNMPVSGLPVSGTGLFSNKAAFAVAKGAIGIVFYNNADGELTAATVRKSTVPTVGISKANGEYLKNAIGSTAFGAVSVNQIRLSKSPISTPDMADFSSKGPVNGYGMIKPDVTAPGVNILSSTVRVGAAETNTATMFDPTGFISASGTSMATPMTAGAAALIKQKNPSWTASMVRAAMMNNATNLRNANGSPLADTAKTLNSQGAGLIDVYAAANTKAMMGVGQIDSPNWGATTPPTYGVFTSTSPGNPDFVGSHSFGVVPIAGVIGSTTRSQTVVISDVRNGAGSGVYALSSSAVRNLPEGVSVSFTNAAGESISQVEVPVNGYASFRVNISVNGESVPANPTQIEWYVTAARTDGGQTLRMPFQFRATRPTVSAVAPVLGAITGNELPDTTPTDINGSYQLSWTYTKPNATYPDPVKFRIQESSDNGSTWANLADVPGTQTTLGISDRGNGTYQYRVTGYFAVPDGLIDGPASAAKAVVVDRRVEADVTSQIQAAIVSGSYSMSGGVTQFNMTVQNTSASAIFTPLTFNITGINSRSGSVSVSNADNSGNGVSSPAAFSFTSQVGGDQRLTPNEVSAARTVRFANPANDLFTLTANVRGYYADGSSGRAAARDEQTEGAASSGAPTGETKTRSALTAGRSFDLTIIVDPSSGTVRVKQ